MVEPYRGYGSDREAFLIGRVFRQVHADRNVDPHDFRAHLRDILRRVRRRTMAGIEVTARLGSATARAVTDRDGYYRIHLDFDALPANREEQVGWHAVDLTVASDPPVEAVGSVFIPPAASRFVVVSDIDDTVMHTGVANKLAMLWRLFVARADSRVAFPGVAAFYRALHDGVGGDEANPVLYVSRAPWGTYDMLTAFFRAHAIPVGPEMFLREWGLSWRHPWPRRAEDHKREVIANMMRVYEELPFVLIGDSGQHDPEVYADIVRENPGRIAAVYIRDVANGAKRKVQVAAIASAVARCGVEMVVSAESAVMAEHAAGLGLLGKRLAGDVPRERRTT